MGRGTGTREDANGIASRISRQVVAGKLRNIRAETSLFLASDRPGSSPLRPPRPSAFGSSALLLGRTTGICVRVVLPSREQSRESSLVPRRDLDDLIPIDKLITSHVRYRESSYRSVRARQMVDVSMPLASLHPEISTREKLLGCTTRCMLISILYRRVRDVASRYM